MRNPVRPEPDDGRKRLFDLESRNPAMHNLFHLIRRIGRSDATVLILGETGTGKELVSHALHLVSKRAGKPFLQVNCGALTDSLLESELFGHERGSFTGAHRQAQGIFEAAHGGTLLLDELEAITYPMQVRLLRVLEQGEVQRIGGRDSISVDVRIVAATNQSLEALVAQGRLREDLYYRLNVMPLHLPPLRERVEDLPLLLDFFLGRCAETEPEEPARAVAPEVLEVLCRYPWPGNIRELKHLVERLWLTCEGPVIGLEQLPRYILERCGGAGWGYDDGSRDPVDRSRSGGEAGWEEGPGGGGAGQERGPGGGDGHREGRIDGSSGPALEGTLAEAVARETARVEQEYLTRTLARFHGRIGLTAKYAGITRRTLYNKLKAYGIAKQDFRGADPDAGDPVGAGQVEGGRIRGSTT